MSTTPIDAFDLLAHAELFEQRLATAAEELAKRHGLTEEKAWLEAARLHVARARAGIGTLPLRALRLPELAHLARGERGRALQGAAVDATENLQAAIRTAGGERSPVLEAIYRNIKFTALRRTAREEFEKFCSEIEKRLASSYVARMLADPTYGSSAAPALEALRDAFADWRSVFTAAPLDAPEELSLRGELETVAAQLDLHCRQARLLAQAALLPAKEILEASAILEKPKKRTARPPRPEAGSEGAQLSLETPETETEPETETQTESAQQDSSE